jgi:hypothetical protein
MPVDHSNQKSINQVIQQNEKRRRPTHPSVQQEHARVRHFTGPNGGIPHGQNIYAA